MIQKHLLEQMRIQAAADLKTLRSLSAAPPPEPAEDIASFLARVRSQGRTLREEAGKPASLSERLDRLERATKELAAQMRPKPC